MIRAWRNFKIIFSRPLFIIIFRPKILFFVTYSILTGDTKVEFVIYWVLMRINISYNYICTVSLIQGTPEEWCTNFGSNYRFIIDTCYYFEKFPKTFNDAKKNCRDKFGSNRNGKLMEPNTMESSQKIQELAENIFGSGDFGVPRDFVLTGFEKHDDAGTDVRHNSDGSRALIKPWQGNGFIKDSGEPYLRFNTKSQKWYDGKADSSEGGVPYFSICESY